MKKIIIALLFMVIAITSFAQEQPISIIPNEPHSVNNWGAKLKSSNFHLGLDLQTKYMWRGMEMMSEESSPVVFPGINYQWKGLYAYAMGGYAINGKYAEVDLGVSYTDRKNVV